MDALYSRVSNDRQPQDNGNRNVQEFDAATVGTSEVAGPDRKPSGTKVSLPQPIRRDIGKFASGFRKKHGFMDRPTAERIARLIRISITPRSSRGRKPTQTVTTAARLLQQKVSWSQIYPVVIPDFEDMDKYERECRTGQLRRNVNRFLKRRGIPCPVRPGRSRKGSKKPTSD